MDNNSKDSLTQPDNTPVVRQNPFNYFEPVMGSDFSNRETIIDETTKIAFRRKAQGNVWIVGERQVGKTSLLHRIVRLHADNHPVIKLYGTNKEFKVLFTYFNCQMIRDENGFYQNLTQCLANHFDFKIKGKKSPYENFVLWLTEIHKKGYYVIFMLDEFDAFIEKFSWRSSEDTAHFLDTLNVLKQNLPGLKDIRKTFGLICAANSTIGELTEELKLSGSGLNFFQELDLSNFSEKQVFDLAAQYLEGNQIRFSENDIRFCFEMTRGYPLFTQHLFSIMYEEKQKIKDGTAPKDFLKSVKKQYGKSFKKVVEDWERQKKITHRTLLKLKDIAKSSKDELKDFSSTVITNLLKDS